MKNVALAFMLLIPLCDSPLAQTQRLDDLERQIEQKRKEKENAAKNPSKAPPSRSAARMVVRSNINCELKVNGENFGLLAVGSAKILTVPPGDQLVECEGTGDPKVAAYDIVKAEASKQVVVTLDMQGLASVALERQADVARKRLQAEAASQAAEQQRQAAEAKERRTSGDYEVAREGVVRDSSTGLHWSQKDNGESISFLGATAYCSALGSTWSLPSAPEILRLYDHVKIRQTKCGSGTCNISSKFKLSGIQFWTREQKTLGTRNRPAAVVAALSDGTADVYRQSDTDFLALCVSSR